MIQFWCKLYVCAVRAYVYKRVRLGGLTFKQCDVVQSSGNQSFLSNTKFKTMHA